MEGDSQPSEVTKPMEFMDLTDTAIEAILNRSKDYDLVNLAYTCQRLLRIIRNFLPQKYNNSLKMSSPHSKEVSLRAEDHIFRPCPSIEAVVSLYPHIEILHLYTYDSWEALHPIATYLTQLRELDLQIRVMGFNHIFDSAERIERMLCIAFEEQLPIQRLTVDMKLGYVAKTLWMIAENLTQLKELELKIQGEIFIGEIEDEHSLRFRTLEKLTVHFFRRSDEGLTMQSIVMFAFDELKDFTLKGLRTPPADYIKFIVQQKKLQKLKLIDCTDVSAKDFCEFQKNLPQLKEIVTDVNDQSVEVLKQQFGSGWTISEHSELYDNILKKAWRFQLIGS